MLSNPDLTATCCEQSLSSVQIMLSHMYAKQAKHGFQLHIPSTNWSHRTTRRFMQKSQMFSKVNQATIHNLNLLGLKIMKCASVQVLSNPATLSRSPASSPTGVIEGRAFGAPGIFKRRTRSSCKAACCKEMRKENYVKMLYFLASCASQCLQGRS